MIGKPYMGKPNVRFDEGELEIEHAATTPALYSTEVVKGLRSQDCHISLPFIAPNIPSMFRPEERQPA
jgi:hypothetical protein